MLVITYNRKKLLKINIKKFVSSLLIIAVFITCFSLYIDFCRFPEKYMTTWKYQLKNEIASGDEKAIEYYNRVYTANGINLFDE